MNEDLAALEADCFHRLRQIRNPKNRRDLLSALTKGQPQFQSRLEALLEAAENPADLLETRAMSEWERTAGVSRTIPEQIGPYRILGLLGEGGMGQVFRAVQEFPVFRNVAIKVLKGNASTSEFLRRFEFERQSLARMDHPHIARLFDAGTTDDGRAFFTMELIEGTSITSYCRTASLSLEERLKLFLSLADAIQHAHQKGVIHRDLKPANVLVTEIDGLPHVKVIDFGVARLLDRAPFSADRTSPGKLVGTLRYMSPEQLQGDDQKVDVRTDVYSLGLILYELLTNSPAIETAGLAKDNLAEICRRIVEEDRCRPSSRVRWEVSDRDDDSSSARRSRVVWKRTLARELDWVVLKAVSREMDDRYSSASALATDVRRFLEHEPLSAIRPTIAYRVFKAWERHAYLLSAAMISLVSLMAATVLSIRHATISERAAAESQRSRSEAQQAEQTAKVRLVKQLNREAELYREQNDFLREVSAAREAFALSSSTPESLHAARLRLARHEWNSPRLVAYDWGRSPRSQTEWDESDVLCEYPDDVSRRADLQTFGQVLRDTHNSKMLTVPDSLRGSLTEQSVVHFPDVQWSLVIEAAPQTRLHDGTPEFQLELRSVSDAEARLGQFVVPRRPTRIRLSSDHHWIGVLDERNDGYVFDVRRRVLLALRINDCAALDFCDHTSQLCTIDQEGTLRVWSLQTGALLNHQGTENPIRHKVEVRFSPDGTLVGQVAFRNSPTLIIRRTSDLNAVLTLPLDRDQLHFNFSPDNAFVAVGNQLWDLQTGKRTGFQFSRFRDVTPQFSRCGRFLGISGDETLIWAAFDQHEAFSYERLPGHATWGLSRGSEVVAISADDTPRIIFSTRPGSTAANTLTVAQSDIPEINDRVSIVRQPYGSNFRSAENGMVGFARVDSRRWLFWDTLQPAAHPNFPDGQDIRDCAYSPNDQLLAVAGQRSITIWERKTRWSKVNELTLPELEPDPDSPFKHDREAPLEGVGFVPSNHMVIAFNSYRMCAWSTKTWKLLWNRRFVQKQRFAVAGFPLDARFRYFCIDGQNHLALIGGSSPLIVDLRTGESSRPLKHSQFGWSSTFCAQRGCSFHHSAYGLFCLDHRTRELTRLEYSDSERTVAMAADPSGRYLAVAGTVLALLDARDGSLLWDSSAMPLISRAFTQCEFSHDSDELFALSGKGVLARVRLTMPKPAPDIENIISLYSAPHPSAAQSFGGRVDLQGRVVDRLTPELKSTAPLAATEVWHAQRATYFEFLEQWCSAAFHLDRLLARHPEDKDVARRLALARFKERRFDLASPVLERLVASGENDINLRKLWGVVLVNQGRAGEGLKEFRSALEVNPADPDLWSWIAMTLLWSGDDREAWAHFQSWIRAAEQQPQLAGRLNWAILFSKWGRAYLSRAPVDVSQWSKFVPTHEYYRAGQHRYFVESARLEFAAYSQNPVWQSRLPLVAVARHYQGRSEEAREVLQILKADFERQRPDLDWNCILESEILFREAEDVVWSDGPPPPPLSRPLNPPDS